jgi:hypothetical protein
MQHQGRLVDVVIGGGLMLDHHLRCGRCGLAYELRHWMAPTFEDAIFGIVSALMYNGFIPPPSLETLLPRFDAVAARPLGVQGPADVSATLTTVEKIIQTYYMPALGHARSVVNATWVRGTDRWRSVAAASTADGSKWCIWTLARTARRSLPRGAERPAQGRFRGSRRLRAGDCARARAEVLEMLARAARLHDRGRFVPLLRARPKPNERPNDPFTSFRPDTASSRASWSVSRSSCSPRRTGWPSAGRRSTASAPRTSAVAGSF